jgi:hypothetical protein
VKKICVPLLLLVFPFLAHAQQIDLEILQTGTISVPGLYQHILSVEFTSSETVIIERCWLDISDTSITDYLYLEIDSESDPPALSFNSQTGFVLPPFLNQDSMVSYPHDVDHLLNFNMSGSAIFDYYADMSGDQLPIQFQSRLHCSVYPYGQSEGNSLTYTVGVGVPVLVSTEETFGSKDILVWGDRIFIPAKEKISICDMLGKTVLVFERQVHDRWETISTSSGIYCVLGESGFCQKHLVFR